MAAERCLTLHARAPCFSTCTRQWVSRRGAPPWRACRYDKKFDPKAADWKKLRVKELRKICDDEGIDAKGFVEKDDYVKKIKAHFNIKDEV